MMNYDSDFLFELCGEYTDLELEDIQLLAHIAKKLPYYSRSRDADVFINCLCKNGEEAIVVAEAIRANSLYEFSTVGYIIQQENEPAVLRSLRCGIETEEVRATTYASSEDCTVVQSVFPIKRICRVIGVLIYEHEYTDYQNYLQQLARPYPTYQLPPILSPTYLTNLDWIGSCIEDGLIVIDHIGCVRYRNAIAQQLYYDYGFVQDILNKEYRKLSLNGAFRPGQQTDSVQREQLKIHDKVYMCSQYWIALPENGFYVVDIHDITQERRNEVMAQLKEITLREVQHRLKNNLYTIYSLLDMKKRRLHSPEAIEVLQDTQDRIMSICSTYEEAASSIDAAPVSLLKYLENIKRHFEEIYQTQDQGIQIQVCGDTILVSSDVAAHIILVVNELMQNCYRHAFSRKGSGIIRVDVVRSAVSKIVSVSDNGSGFDSHRIEERRENGSMGLQIAETIVREALGGKLTISSSLQGTRVWFDFK